MKKLLILTFLLPNLCFAGAGLYPSVGFGLRFGSDNHTITKDKDDEMRVYGAAKVHLIKWKAFDGNSALKLLGAGINYSDEGETFYTVTPFTFQTNRNLEMGLDIVLDPNGTTGGSVGVTLGYGF